MKCGRIGCIANGEYQPMIRIRASVLPADGKDILAMIRLPWTLCPTHKAFSHPAQVIAAIPAPRMKIIVDEAFRRTGARPNPDRTDVLWVKITGR